MRAERGSASLLGVAAIGVLMLMTMAAVFACGLVVAHRQAQAAADLGALSAAIAHQRGDEGCGPATAVAHKHGAELRSCAITDDIAVVRVSVASPTWWGFSYDLQAEARAGPQRSD